MMRTHISDGWKMMITTGAHQEMLLSGFTYLMLVILIVEVMVALP